MTHLNIQQGSNAEIVSALIIKKLYDTALTVSEPLEGETDAAYMSGNLLVNKAFRKACTYLTTRFPNLYIAALDYYIDFEDPAVELLLITKGVSSDGVGVTESDAANTTLSRVFYTNMNVYNGDVTKFNEFTKFTLVKTNIPNNLFRNCSNLEEINLSDTITIGESSFRSSGIKDINIPMLQSLGREAFEQTKVETITSLGTILGIPDYAFWRCVNLTSAVLPTTLTSIGVNAFSMTNAEGSRVFTTISGLENVTSFGESCFASNNNLQIQASVLSKAQTIGNLAFREVKVVGLLYTKDLISLGEQAFRNNPSLTSIECLGKISSIPNSCFKQDTALQTVKIPYECVNIVAGAFLGCSSLTSITLYNKSLDDYAEGESPTFTNISRITSFGQSCFEGCSLLNLTPQDIQNATTIDNNAFRGVSLSGILNLPNLTGKIGSNSFLNDNISSISSLGSVTEIGERAFENTNISSITIPNSVTKCASNFVSNTIVPEIIFPEGVEWVSGGLLYTKNNSLTYIEIPSTVTNMGYFFHRALEGSSSNICTVIIKATTPPKLNYYVDGGGKILSHLTRCESFAGIYVPDASLTAYQNAANAWQHSSIQAKLKPISQLQTDNPTAWAKYNRV